MSHLKRMQSRKTFLRLFPMMLGKQHYRTITLIRGTIRQKAGTVKGKEDRSLLNLTGWKSAQRKVTSSVIPGYDGSHRNIVDTPGLETSQKVRIVSLMAGECRDGYRQR